MGRVKLELPQKFSYSTELTLRITDINYGQHLGNDAVLALMHEARMRFLASFGFSERDAGGAGMIMTDAIVVYKSQAVFGETIVMDVTVQDIAKTGCDFYFRLTNKETGKEVARGKTGIAFFDYESNRLMKVPQPFKDAVNNGG